jgi:hypothetical protein
MVDVTITALSQGPLLVVGWSLEWRWVVLDPGSGGPVPWLLPYDTVPADKIVDLQQKVAEIGTPEGILFYLTECGDLLLQTNLGKVHRAAVQTK